MVIGIRRNEFRFRYDLLGITINYGTLDFTVPTLGDTPRGPYSPSQFQRRTKGNAPCCRVRTDGRRTPIGCPLPPRFPQPLGKTNQEARTRASAQTLERAGEGERLVTGAAPSLAGRLALCAPYSCILLCSDVRFPARLVMDT
jgi:hypothetical protein